MSKLKCPYCGRSDMLELNLKAYVPMQIHENGEIELEQYSEGRDNEINDSVIDCIGDEDFDMYCDNCGRISKIAKMDFNEESEKLTIVELKKIKGEEA